MMKSIHSTLVTVFAVTLFTLPALKAEETVRYVDMSRLFTNYYKTVRSQKSLKKQEEIYKERAEELVEEIKNLREKVQTLEEKSLNVGVSKEERDKSRRQANATENLYQAKQKQLRTFMQSKQQDLRKQYMQMRKTLVDEILGFIRDHAKQKNIDTVFDVSGLTNNLLPTILHYPQEKDITDSIIKKLNKGHEDEVPDGGVEQVETPKITPEL
ncbi:MAG: OmpH family outer membrane protein [Lentisphaeria bacterium]